MGTEYRIDFTITRRTDEDDDFVEIGFGSSGAWENINAASYAMESDIQNGMWETSEGMPDPESVRAQLEDQ
jgi:hypothetical protein